ncbi:Homocysteine S-methyltransferase [Melanomma pulvis-pyrius CBS 109.77]|uniref:Homocysteine S-methyltransferase n=1 Tax=Melanomma pulvis-pyrius CBS 109.77 TaxID=1314802 RepID=A0A6A6WT38_9PLEO|nr:Homocysteine S-methyltransferase [Melanomma pulvis-pyrius CBS 109.77]
MSSSDSETPTLSALLTSKPSTPLILDGALATYLELLGADISTALWSATLLLSQPSLIHKTHLDYYHAGADIAITASYQASVQGLQKHLNLPEHEAKNVVKKSVELAIQARSDYLGSLTDEVEKERKSKRLLVAGSVGPYGAFLADGSEYRGDYVLSKSSMKDFHRGRISALIEAGCDVLACETLPSIGELEALVELLEEFPGTEAWFSFTMKDAEHISDGTSLDKVCETLKECKQAVAVGVNCVPEETALGALKQLAKLTSKPLVVYPNSGEQWNAESRSWQGERNKGAQLAERTKEWWNAGARLIGGCCRTTPEDINIIEQSLRGVQS